ncbi:ras association domain-containing protein 2-like isoform X2 [Acanthaster planci]|uniref:Ras association domain-containing protein 2-like isoform X2 n=1 Tax=Acanthaster planci TaxID=133434 RepID=A0A8B7Y2I7_ACAPL|nr:ras association domain-containing protein 2-like isoform X2 [Acanthaster planci]
MDSQDLQEHQDRFYRTIIQSGTFMSQLKTFNMHLSDSKTNQELEVIQENGMPVLFGMLKIYWGTQKVIRLKQEELSWKRRSTRVVFENGLDEHLLSILKSGGENKGSVTKPSDHKESDSRSSEDQKPSGQTHTDRSSEQTGAGADNGADEEGAEEDRDTLGEKVVMRAGQTSTVPRRCNLQRRTMSFSGHLYNSKTAAFRPKYGTVSNVRVSSRQTTYEVIALLLKKFAVENRLDEFNLYSVLHNGETHAFQMNDFPLLKRVQLGPNENVAKIFIKEKKSDEISPEVAGYVNLRIPELKAILRKFQEEEEKEVMKIRQRYVQYRATLNKKLALLKAEIEKEAKFNAKHKNKEKKKSKKSKGKK